MTSCPIISDFMDMVAKFIYLFISLQGLSEMCCFAVTQLLMIGKSIISNANRDQDPNVDEEIEKIDWPEDSVEKAKIVRIKAQRMSGIVEAVSNSFITGKFVLTLSMLPNSDRFY